jgi:small-conductance mechanosensitive channel
VIELRPLVAQLRDLDVVLFHLGGTAISVFALLRLVILLSLLVWVSRHAGRWLSDRLLARTHLDLGTRRTAGAVVRYTILVMGVAAIAQTLGINLTALSVLAGAVGVGVGFGLQNIFSNFISGLIVMFERPVKIGDRVEIGAVRGDVLEIGARRATIVTNDNIAVIVPNQRFITENVTNLRYFDAPIRLRTAVTVAAGTEPRRIEALLLEVARASANVLAEPPPRVRLLAFQPNGATTLELQVWNDRDVHDPDALVSDLNFAIADAFAAAGIKTA